MTLARRYIVRGTVQGVGYRFFTCTCADALGIRGWVKNLPDGTVEVHAEGDEEQLKEFEFDLSRGARYARVSGVDSRDVETGSHSDFKIRR